MGVQIHMRHGNGEYNNSYARVEDFVDDRDVVVHAKGSCDPCIKKEKEVIANDYNLDIDFVVGDATKLEYEDNFFDVLNNEVP